MMVCPVLRPLVPGQTTIRVRCDLALGRVPGLTSDRQIGFQIRNRW